MGTDLYPGSGTARRAPGHRRGRHQERRRGTRACPRRGLGDGRRHDEAGGGDAGRQGRGGRRDGHHAPRRKLPGGGLPGEGSGPRHPAVPSGEGPDRGLLRPDLPDPGLHPDGGPRTPSGRILRDPRSVSSSRGIPDGDGRRRRFAPHLSLRVPADGVGRDHREPDEPGRTRVLGGHGG